MGSAGGKHNVITLLLLFHIYKHKAFYIDTFNINYPGLKERGGVLAHSKVYFMFLGITLVSSTN